jgi:hypothetical protein
LTIKTTGYICGLAYVSTAYVSIRQHTSAYVSIAYVSIRQHTSAYVSIRQHSMWACFCHICVLKLLYRCPHTTICVLITLHVYYATRFILLYVCPHSTTCVLIRLCPHTTICILILLYVSSYYMCPHNTRGIILYICLHTTTFVSSYLPLRLFFFTDITVSWIFFLLASSIFFSNADDHLSVRHADVGEYPDRGEKKEKKKHVKH